MGFSGSKQEGFTEKELEEYVVTWEIYICITTYIILLTFFRRFYIN